MEPMADLPTTADRCPCGRGRPLAECCGPILAGHRPASTAEELMRSRFTAFARGDGPYLRASWAPETRPSRVRFDPAQRWTTLEIVDTAAGGLLDQEGEVEFVARFERAGEPGAIHERSRFRRHEGRWAYVDGDHR